MRNFIKSGFVAALSFCVILSAPAIAGRTGKENDPLEYVTHLLLGFLFHKTVTVANNAHAWVAATLGLVDQRPEEIPIHEDDLPHAQVVLDEILQRGEEHNRKMQMLLRRLGTRNVDTLLRIIVTPTVAPDFRFLATTVLRNNHILPRLAEGRYAQIGAINRRFLEVADANNENHREIARRIFAFTHPDPEVRLTEPTLDAFLEIHRGNTGFREALSEWFRGVKLKARAAHARETIILENPALEEVQLRIIALVDEIKITPPNDQSDFVALFRELHGVIMLFESLAAESTTKSVSSRLKKILPNAQIKETMSVNGSERVALTGDYEIDALLLGFEKDHDLVAAAEAVDASDSKHKISKGDSFIRGNLIISRDIDAHAGSAYKLHAMTGRNRWEYLDTVVLTQVGDEWMFLLLNRTKRYSEDYWFLVNSDGQWFRINKNVQDAKPEPVAGPMLKEIRARRAPAPSRRRGNNH